MTAVLKVNPYAKATWLAYTEAMIHEAKIAIKQEGLEIRSSETINPEIRPLAVVKNIKEQTRLQKLSNIFSLYYTPANATLKITNEYENLAFQLKVYHSNLLPSPLPSSLSIDCISKRISDLIEKKIKPIDQWNANEVNSSFYTRLLFVLGTTTWITGVFISGKWVITAGKTFIAAAVALYIYNRFSHRNDEKRFKNEYASIEEEAETIRFYLSYYTDNMKLCISVQGSKYTPLYDINLPITQSTLSFPEQLENVSYNNLPT